MRKMLAFLTIALGGVLLLAACAGDTAQQSEIRVGAEAPAFTLPNAAGGEVSLADYEGQPVLLYFHMAVG